MRSVTDAYAEAHQVWVQANKLFGVANKLQAHARSIRTCGGDEYGSVASRLDEIAETTMREATTLMTWAAQIIASGHPRTNDTRQPTIRSPAISP